MLIDQSRLLKKFRKKVRILPSGTDVTKFNKITSNLKNELKIMNSKVILYVGALRDYKGLQFLINAFPKIKTKIKNAKLIMIGKGDQELKLRKLIEKLQIENDVLMPGFVTENELIKFYSIADVFVLPSPTLAEGFGLVAIEALSSGVPTIITSGAGISEVFKKYNIGEVVEPKNSLEIAERCIKIIKDKKKKKKIKKYMRKVRERFNWGTVSKGYLQMFNKVLKQNE